ncbi:hypothetical protein M9Y10_004244 [Tritrichomonas musculus]|uniref:Ankyrin repeat protein n=1 Tax=Tritrichomonas musculus TaxID=1915356 RepID=A0ABR2JSU2_9EUKA
MNDVISSIQKDDASKFEELYLNTDTLHSFNYSIENDRSSNINKFIPMNNLDLIHVAAYYDSIKCFTFLHNQGKSIHLKTPANFTPLQYACLGGSLKIATFICQNTEDKKVLNDYPNYGPIPINLAISSKSPQTLQVLLTNGVKLPKIAINDAFSPFIEAIKINIKSPESLSILFQHAFSESKEQKQDEKSYLIEDPENYSLIMRSITSNSHECLHFLVENKIGDVSFQTKNGDFALQLALLVKDEEVVDYLLKNGAKLDMKNKLGQYPIHLAASTDNVNIVRMILANGCDVNAKDSRGRTPAFSVCLSAKNMDKILQLLINAGCDINVGDRQNLTVADQMIIMDPTPQLLESIKIILENGFDLNHVGGRNTKTVYQKVKLLAPKQIKDVFDEYIMKHPGIVLK